MAGEHVNELYQLYFAGRHGFLVNSNDGFYQRGKSYGMETKLFVAAKYLDHKERLGGLRPVLTKVAAECHVGWDFVAKIERELEENDRVLTPEEIYLARDNPIGPGSMSMPREDFFVLYMLLPARAPEWNPIELMWNCLCQRLKYFDVSTLTGFHRDVAAAVTILNEITHEEIFRFYWKSGVFEA